MPRLAGLCLLLSCWLPHSPQAVRCTAGAAADTSVTRGMHLPHTAGCCSTQLPNVQAGGGVQRRQRRARQVAGVHPGAGQPHCRRQRRQAHLRGVWHGRCSRPAALLMQQQASQEAWLAWDAFGVTQTSQHACNLACASILAGVQLSRPAYRESAAVLPTLSLLPPAGAHLQPTAR